MVRRTFFALCSAAAVALVMQMTTTSAGAADHAYNHQWGYSYKTQDWQRFYHYPYVYYPQNFRGSEYYRSADNLYYRYPPEMRIPVYNKSWHNYYPQGRKYHFGHHFILDVF